MSEIDMNQPIVDLNEKTELLSKRQRLLKLMKTSKFWKDVLGKGFVYLMLIDFAVVFLIPIIYMVITGIESSVDFADASVVWIPKRPLYVSNMRAGVQAMDYWTTLWYTIKVVAACTLGHIFSGALVGYALGRLKFTGRNLLFGFVLLTLVVPAQALFDMNIRTYVLLMNDMDMIYRIIIPCFLGCGLNGGIFIFVFRQVYAGLPKELEEAAMIDGCGIFKTFTKIMLPLTSSAVLVCVILSVVWHWNDLYESSSYITAYADGDTYLMSQRVYHLFLASGSSLAASQSNYLSDYNGEQPTMWCTFLSLAPILAMYLLVQRNFMESVASTGIKG